MIHPYQLTELNEPEVPLVLYMGFSNVQLLVLERSLYLSLGFIRKRTTHFENFDWTFFDGYTVTAIFIRLFLSLVDYFNSIIDK